MPRRRLKFEPGVAGAEAAQPERLGPGSQKERLLLGGVQAGLKFNGCPTQPEPILESLSVYLQKYYFFIKLNLY